ncbi:MAG: hypothetical protein HZC41_21530 [Chloroflexi bacterium]|nr:hypothetical protein [Chloroflexota bacterium]
MLNQIVRLAALLLIAALAGCAGQSTASEAAAPYSLAPASGLPDFLSDAPPRVREAYQFAVANPHALETVPCYCGCGNMGHKSNLNCYVKEIDKAGNVIYDNHADGCGICVDITQDVMRLMRDGRSPTEIRAYVDSTYSSFGPSTDTVMPQG